MRGATPIRIFFFIAESNNNCSNKKVGITLGIFFTFDKMILYTYTHIYMQIMQYAIIFASSTAFQCILFAVIKVTHTPCHTVLATARKIEKFKLS